MKHTERKRGDIREERKEKEKKIALRKEECGKGLIGEREIGQDRR